VSLLSRLSVLRLTCFAAATASAGLAQTSGGTDVALGFQITTEHTGTIKTPGLKLPLTIRWSIDLPGTASYPIIAQGDVFVISSGPPSTLWALSAQTGATVWSQPIPSGFGEWIGAAYENGVLFVVPNSNPMFGSGAMFAFSAKDGSQVWSANLPGQYSFSSAPTAKNGIVYTGGAGEGGTVYAVQETNGLVLWTEPVENGDSSAPAVTQNGVYVSYVCPQTYRFNPKTGKQVWHYSGGCEGGGGESAAVYQGLVYARDVNADQSAGVTLDATNGTLVGSFTSSYAPAFWDTSAIYIGADTVTAADITTGATVWTAVAPAGESYSCASVVVNGIVYVPTSAGNLYGYEASNGKKAFSIGLGNAVACGEYFAVPLVGLGGNDGLLVVPADGKVVALQ
jgi:outer membrane protein assembly factor BamB